jgi:hypothetical protein
MARPVEPRGIGNVITFESIKDSRAVLSVLSMPEERSQDTNRWQTKSLKTTTESGGVVVGTTENATQTLYFLNFIQIV